MLDVLILTIAFLIAMLIAVKWLYPSSKKVSTISGLDPSSKEEGNLSDIARAGSLHEFLLDLHSRFGDIAGFWWGQTYVVSIASPELFKAHANVFDRPAELFLSFKVLSGSSSLQYANGSEGRRRRKAYDRPFSHENLKKYFPEFQEIAGMVEKKWSTKSETDHIPVCEDMASFSLRTTLLTLMGDSFQDEKLVQTICNAYTTVWDEMERRLTDPAPLGENGARQKSFTEALQCLNAVVKNVVDHRQNKVKDQQLLIDVILQSTTEEDVVTSDVITYLVAAFHTSANLLTWAMYFLATHPDVQSKLHSEIVQVLGQKDVVTDSSCGELRYLHQVLQETLRCAVIAPWGARVQDVDSELGGHKVLKNTPVIHGFGVVMQNEKLWPFPQRFDPDRFSIENSKDHPPYAFSPFGFAGKRICPGYKFAYKEATVLIATLIRKFEVSMWDDQVVKPVFGLVTHPQEEIWLKVSKRK
ncbi:cytochrome P450 20A1-like [Aplysia californica]|uniref:Cytochrome P450 20A1-like n=1 Tax=Aplysia californica TaxID=6500 RepID=A0ABM1VX00_APLCA|nr:cytochrome P450 20A1-like [Aplysia californica]